MLSVSIQDLQPNPQDTAAFYLANIYQLLAAANGTQVSIPSTLSNPASSFTPPRFAIWVNSLWFLSLAISLTCALLATLLQQWVRRYIKITQFRSSPHTRGRTRAFFSEGIDKLHLPRVVEALPILLHLSLFLFFSGLLVFLFNIDHTVFSAIAWWVGLCTVTYICITFMPLFLYDSPYYAPLSSSAWYLATGVLALLFQALWWLAGFTCVSRSKWEYFGKRKKHYRDWFARGLTKTAGEFARKLSPKIDGRALMWTLDCSDQDQELERFFAGIPGFCRSKVLNDPIGTCINPNMERMSEALIGLVHRTLTSNLVAPKVMKQRLIICREAISAASLRISPQIFHRIINAEWEGLLNSIEFGLLLGETDRSDPVTAYHSQMILSIILQRAQARDDSWFRLATDHLGCSESILRDYLAHGDSISLASSIRVLRNIIHDHFDPFCLGDSRWKVLELVSEFDIRDTLPTLQQDFCDLWNEVVLLARSTPDARFRSVYIAILRNVRNAYIALHQQDTNSAPTAFFSSSTTDNALALMLPSSYPLCNISGHRLHPTSHTGHPSVASHVPSFPAPHPYNHGSQQAHYLAPSLAPQNIFVSSSFAPQITQINVDQRLGTVTPTSDSTPIVNATIVLSTQSSEPVPHFTSTVTTSPASLPAETSPSGTAPASPAFYVNVPLSVPPDTPAFPVPVFNDTVEPSLVSQSAVDPATSRSDHSWTSVTTSSVAPPRLTPALDRRATDGEGSARVALRNDKATGSLSAQSATTMNAPHNSVQPPQPPEPRLSADTAIASPSRLSQDDEQRENQPPHPLRGDSISKT